MISDEELNRYEKEVEDMAGLGEPAISEKTADEPKETSPKRIDRIVEKALYQSVVKDTASFVFNSFGSALFGLTGAVMGHAAQSAPERKNSPTPPSRGDSEDDSDSPLTRG